MIGVSLIVSSLVERMCRGKRVRVQAKTVVRISHHCGFAASSQTTIPGLSPVALAVSTLNGSNSVRRVAEKGMNSHACSDFTYEKAMAARTGVEPVYQP